MILLSLLMVLLKDSFLVLVVSGKVILFNLCFFFLVMEAFRRLMLRAKEGGHTDSFLVSSTGLDAMAISHLLFANETLAFCDADLDQLHHLQCILLCFETIFGLHRFR